MRTITNLVRCHTLPCQPSHHAVITQALNHRMARKPGPGALPCSFCGKGFRSLRDLTTHLDTSHETWVHLVMSRIGLPAPDEYPIEEYRRALAEALVQQQFPAPEN